jgi:hypothetical protein
MFMVDGMLNSMFYNQGWLSIWQDLHSASSPLCSINYNRNTPAQASKHLKNAAQSPSITKTTAWQSTKPAIEQVAKGISQGDIQENKQVAKASLRMHEVGNAM